MAKPAQRPTRTPYQRLEPDSASNSAEMTDSLPVGKNYTLIDSKKKSLIISMGWLTGTHHASRSCNMGNAEEFRIRCGEAATGVVACLVLMVYAALDLLAFSIGGVGGAAARAGRADDASGLDRPIQSVWSIQPRGRHGSSIRSALPLAEGQLMAKSRNIDLASTGKYLDHIKKSASVLFSEFVNIDLKQNKNSDRHGIFTAAVSQALYFGVGSTKEASLHVAAGGVEFASFAEEYFIPT